MSAKRQRTKQLDASDLTPQSSSNPASTACYPFQYSTVLLVCDGTSHEHAASTTARLDRLNAPDQLCPHAIGLSLQDLQPPADLKVSAFQSGQSHEACVSPQCDPVFDSFQGVRSWSGSTCVGSPSQWSTTTYVSVSEHCDGLTDRLIEDKEKSDPQDHQSGKDGISKSSSTPLRMHISTNQNVRPQGFYDTHWPKLIKPWSSYNLRSENHVHQTILESILRGISPFKNGIIPQRDTLGSMWNPIKLPILCSELDGQHSHLSDRLLKMLAVLDPQMNPGRANNFFNGLDILVGDLRNRFPNDSVVSGLVRALERLELFYLLNFVEASTNLNQWSPACKETEDGTDSEIAKDKSHHTTGCSPSGLNSATAPYHGKHSDDGNLTPGDRNSSDGPQLSRKRRIQSQKPGRQLACPIRRHQEVHDQPLTCDFGGAANMWTVTQHLRKRVHRNSLPFVVLCRHCWTYVTNQDEYRNVHKDNLCGLNSQPRGHRVSEHWQKLYRSIYPRSDRIPSPWIGEHQPQHAILSGLHNTTRPSGTLARGVDPSYGLSFLDDDPMASNSPVTFTIPQTLNQQAISSTEQQAELAALDLFNSLYQDSFRRPGDLGDYYLNQLVVEQASQLPQEQIQQFADRFRERAIEIADMLQLQAENDTLQATNAPVFPTSRSDTSEARDGEEIEAALDLLTPPHSQNWLGQFPVPEQMLVNPFQIATPAQQVYPYDLLSTGDWLLDEPSDQTNSSLRSILSSPLVS